MMTRDESLIAQNQAVAQISRTVPMEQQADPLIAALVKYARLTSRDGLYVLIGFAQENARHRPLQTEQAQVLKFPKSRKGKR